MDNGYYWLTLKGEEPQVVEVEDGWMYCCGNDVAARLEGGRWIERGEELAVVSIVGPLMPPSHTRDADEIERAAEGEYSTVDDMIVKLRALSDAGLGDYIVGCRGEFFLCKNADEPSIDHESKVVDFIGYA